MHIPERFLPLQPHPWRGNLYLRRRHRRYHGPSLPHTSRHLLVSSLLHTNHRGVLHLPARRPFSPLQRHRQEPNGESRHHCPEHQKHQQFRKCHQIQKTSYTNVRNSCVVIFYLSFAI